MDNGYVPPHLRKRPHGVPSEKTYKKTIEVTDDHANLDADQGFDDTDNADQITESGNKNAVHMDYKQGCADMDSNNPKDSKIVFVNDLKNRSNEKFADQDDTNRDVADQGTTMNNRKVVNNRADQDEDMNTDTSDQETTSGNRDVVSNFEIDKDKDGIEDADRIVYLAILH